MYVKEFVSNSKPQVMRDDIDMTMGKNCAQCVKFLLLGKEFAALAVQ